MSRHRKALEMNAAELVADGKGILAADESNGTMTKRMEAVGATSTPANAVWRRDWASNGEIRTSRCTPFSALKRP